MEYTEEKKVTRNIRSCRAQSSMSQQQMADALNITRQTYQRWELHPYKMQITDFIRLGNVLGVDWHIFFCQ